MSEVNEFLCESTVDRVEFDFAVSFLFWRFGHVRIQDEATIRVNGEEPKKFDPEEPQDVALALLKFLHQEARMLLEGDTLVIAASDESLELRVEPSEEYEAWVMRLDDGGIIVSTPGGELTRWTGNNPQVP